MAQFETYRDIYPNFLLERTPEGILTVTFHTDGGPHVVTGANHTALPELLHNIATDLENEVVILTGAGNYWMHSIDFSQVGDISTPWVWHRILTEARRTVIGFLEVPVPVIAAIPGPAHIHGEYAMTADSVIAADTASFQDDQHLPVGVVPADGVQVLWAEAMGRHRAKHFLFTGQTIGAEEALAFGMVHEIVPERQIMERASQLAQQYLKIPSLTRRYTRLMFARHLMVKANQQIAADMGLEGLSILGRDLHRPDQ